MVKNRSLKIKMELNLSKNLTNTLWTKPKLDNPGQISIPIADSNNRKSVLKQVVLESIDNMLVAWTHT